MTVAAITAMMITGVSKEQGVFWIRCGIQTTSMTSKSFVWLHNCNPRWGRHPRPLPEEKAVMEKASPFRVAGRRQPARRHSDAGRAAFSARTGVVSPGQGRRSAGSSQHEVSLKNAQAGLRISRQWISLIALGLGLPMWVHHLSCAVS
jgi:hypothetical protein